MDNPCAIIFTLIQHVFLITINYFYNTIPILDINFYSMLTNIKH